MQTKKYPSVRSLTDIVRAGFIAHNAYKADQIVARLAESYLSIVDEGWVVTSVGYFDRKILVKDANGLVCEVRIWTPNLLEAKESNGGHVFYEKYKKSTNEWDEWYYRCKQRRLYREAMAQEDESFRELLETLTRTQ